MISPAIGADQGLASAAASRGRVNWPRSSMLPSVEADHSLPP